MAGVEHCEDDAGSWATATDRVGVIFIFGQRLQKPYIRLMADWTREVLAWAGDTPVLLGVPVYDDADSGYHHPEVENLANALAGIHAGLTARSGALQPYQGVAVYADWEWDDAERRLWRRNFIRQPAGMSKQP